MRMSEPGRTSGVGIPTITICLRERSLPSGGTRATRATWTQGHPTRRKLNSVMSGTARPSLAEIRQVLAELGRPGTVLNGIIGDRGRSLREDSPTGESTVQTIPELPTTDRAWAPEMSGADAGHAAALAGMGVHTLDGGAAREHLLGQIVQGALLRRHLVDALVRPSRQGRARQRFPGNGARVGHAG